MSKLNQIIAIEKGIKNRVQTAITGAYHKAQKPVLFGGFTKSYAPKDADGETFPTEKKNVEVKVAQLTLEVRQNLNTLFDITATKDYANCNAKANLVVDGVPLMTEVPATYLLFLEKQLVDLRTFVGSIPTLDPSKEWTWDSVTNLYKTPVTQTVKTKKVQRPIVLYDATEKHPAQTQLITEDQTVGNWNQIEMSGAMSETDKASLETKVNKLLIAVKKAREEANMVEASDISTSPVLEWLFNA